VTCELEGEQTVSGTVRDISVGGVFVQANAAPTFGSKVTLVITLPGLKSQSRLPGVVRWNKPDGFGVQFGLLGARETHAITQLMRAQNP
jgi:type IV pilus assembly protein PilZ